MWPFDYKKKKQDARRSEEAPTPMQQPKTAYKPKSVQKNLDLPANIQKIIDAAKLGIRGAQMNDAKTERENLFNLFNLVQSSCSQLLNIPDNFYNTVGAGFSLLLSYRQVQQNENLAIAIADYAFYCYSRAIEADPDNKTLHLKRLSVLAETKDFFYNTVAAALNLQDSNPFGHRSMIPLLNRTNDYIYAMGKYDLLFLDGQRLTSKLGEFKKLCESEYVYKNADEGKKTICDILRYLTSTFRKY